VNKPLKRRLLIGVEDITSRIQKHDHAIRRKLVV
jgi:hypothetical protein